MSSSGFVTPTPDIFVWGSCEDGQLGVGTKDVCQILTPQPLNSPKLPSFTQIACGYKHTLLLTHDGEVYSCGCNEYQQLGHKEPGHIPTRIVALEQHRIINVACGAYHNAAVTYKGHLLTWGCNSNGQLGREGEDTSVKLVRALADHRVVQVSLGIEHSLVLTDTSRLFVFGANTKGQLGLGYASEHPISIPQQVLSLSGLPIRRVVAGGSHSFVLTVSGELYSWGDNSRGQLGLGHVGANNVHSDVNANPTTLQTSSTQGSISASVSEQVPPKIRPNTPVGISQSCVPVPTVVKSLKNCQVVYVVCGELHTAVLTRDGGVFTFGAGRYGQLGHSESTTSMPLPRKVTEFMGNTVTQIACGRLHTLALIPSSNRLYSFGAGASGQLGVGDMENRLTPSPIEGPWLAANNSNIRTSAGQYVILRAFTGGDHVYMITVQTPTNGIALADDFRIWNRSSFKSIVTLCPEIVCQLQNALNALPLPAPISRSSSLSSSSSVASFTLTEPRTTVSQIETVFSSLGCLSASCLLEEETRNHFNTNREEHGLDLDLAHSLQTQVFQMLPTKNLRNLINKLMDGVLSPSRSNYPSIESLRGLMVLAVSDLLNMPSYAEFENLSTLGFSNPSTTNLDSETVLYPVLLAGFSSPSLVLNAYSMAINKLDPAPSKILDKWFLKIQPRFLKKLVLNLNNMVTFTLDMQPSTVESQRKLKEEAIRNALEFMKRLHRVNENHPIPISYTTFYIPSLKDKININSAFVNWLQECHSGGMRFFSFWDYPFVFDASSKAQMLNIESRLIRQYAIDEARQNAYIQAVLSPLVGASITNTVSPFFTIVVHRDNILRDTLTHLTMASPNDFRKLLKVKFENEEAVDEGGVMKEFFLLLMRDLLDPVYGMFRCYPESRMLWFNETTMENESVFQMVGILCGLAIYNSIIIDLSFPLAMFRKLLGGSPGLDDLKELDPVVGRSLQQLLDYDEPDLSEVFCLNFSVAVNYFGTTRTVPLIENGEQVVVTQENRSLYVDKYVDYVFNKSCKVQFDAFEKGFMQVCDGYTLKLFQPTELQALVVGSEVVDWNDLRQNTTYQGVYWDRHPVIEWFWEVVLLDFSVEDKKKFLRFLTGCDRVPVVGFSGVKISIQPNNSGDDHLPVAHTCANLLDLPLYSSKEILANKLSLAIQQTEGFGLV